MDPNACLEEIRYIVSTREAIDAESMQRLIDLNDALDNWLKNGGFLPSAWDKARK